MLSSPATIAPPFLGLWPLLGAAAGPGRGRCCRPGAGPRAAPGTWWSRPCSVTPMRSWPAARAGQRTPTRRSPPPRRRWGRWWRGTGSTPAVSPREAALADGWGEPVGWLREAAAYFAARGDDRVAAACRALLRRAGAPVPRRRPGDGELPGRLRALGVTEREADVLSLARAGPGQPGDRGADVPVAAHRREARGQPAGQDRPAPGAAGWVFRRARWVAAARRIG